MGKNIKNIFCYALIFSMIINSNLINIFASSNINLNNDLFLKKEKQVGYYHKNYKNVELLMNDDSFDLDLQDDFDNTYKGSESITFEQDTSDTDDLEINDDSTYENLSTTSDTDVYDSIDDTVDENEDSNLVGDETKTNDDLSIDTDSNTKTGVNSSENINELNESFVSTDSEIEDIDIELNLKKKVDDELYGASTVTLPADWWGPYSTSGYTRGGIQRSQVTKISFKKGVDAPTTYNTSWEITGGVYAYLVNNTEVIINIPKDVDVVIGSYYQKELYEFNNYKWYARISFFSCMPMYHNNSFATDILMHSSMNDNAYNNTANDSTKNVINKYVGSALSSIEGLQYVAFNNMDYMFCHLSNMTNLYLACPNFNNASSYNYTFGFCTNLRKIYTVADFQNTKTDDYSFNNCTSLSGSSSYSSSNMSSNYGTRSRYFTNINVYTVSFNMNGHGTEISSQQVVAGHSVTKPNNPTDTGYTFIRWYTTNENTAYNFQSSVNSNFTLYAKWDENEYNINLVENDGVYVDGYTEPTKRLYSESVNLPTKNEIEKTNNYFLGWYENSDFSGDKVETVPAYVTEDVTLYAKWIEHANHKICGEINDCSHTLTDSHEEIINWEMVDEDISYNNFVSLFDTQDTKYLFLTSNISTTSTATITLKSDIYLCLNGYSLTNFNFTVDTSSQDHATSDSYKLCITNCQSSTSSISVDSYLSNQIMLSIYGISQNINISINKLMNFTLSDIESSSVTQNNINIYSAVLSQSSSMQLDDYLFNISNGDGDNLISGFAVDLEEVKFDTFNVKSMLFENVDVNIKNVTIENISSTDCIIDMAGSGDVNFYGDNYIQDCVVTSEHLFNSNFKTTFNDGTTNFINNKLNGDNADSLLYFSDEFCIKEGASLNIDNNLFKRNASNQNMLLLPENNLISGNFYITNNKFVSADSSDNYLLSALYLKKDIKMNIGTGNIVIKSNNAYSSQDGQGTYLNSQHVFQLYSMTTDYNKSIINLDNSLDIGTDTLIDGIAFASEYGFGRIMDNTPDNYNANFVADNNKNNELKIFFDDNHIVIRNPEYHILYYPNGGIGSVIDTIATSSIATKLLNNSFTRDNFRFLGWSLTPSVTPSTIYYETDYKEGIDYEKTVSDDGEKVELYAVWFNLNTEYIVSFDMMGHGQQIASLSIIFGNLVDKPSTPSTVGWTFIKWYKDNTFLNEWDFLNDKVEDNIILYALWSENEYNITLNIDAYSHYVDTYSVPTKRKYTESINLPTDADVKREGYRVDGWYESSDYSDIATMSIAAYTDSDKILYLKWKPITYQVEYLNIDNDADITGSSLKQDAIYDGNMNRAPSNKQFTKPNKIFLYYEHALTLVNNATYSNTTYLSSRTRLYANEAYLNLTSEDKIKLMYKPVFGNDNSYTITYYANNNTIEKKSINYTYDKNAYISTNLFKYDGYNFLGWSKSSTSNTVEYIENEEIFMDVDEDDINDIDLYAVWEKIEYTVVFTTYDDNSIIPNTDYVFSNIFYLDTNNAPNRSYYSSGDKILASYEFVKAVLNGNEVDLTPSLEIIYPNETFSKLTKVAGVTLYYKIVFINKASDSYTIYYHANNNTDDVSIQYASYSEITYIKNNEFTYFDHKFQGYSLEKNSKKIVYRNGDRINMKIEDGNELHLFVVWSKNTHNEARGSGGSGGGGSSYSGDPFIGVNGLPYAKYYVQNEEVYILSYNKSTGGDGNNGNKMHGKWFYDVNVNKWKYLTDPIDKIVNPNILTQNDFLVNGIYMIGNEKYCYKFDGLGYMETGFLLYNSHIYYAETHGIYTGALYKGYNSIDGLLYNFNDYTAEFIPPKDGVYEVTNGEVKYNTDTGFYNYYRYSYEGVPILLTNGVYTIRLSDEIKHNYYFDIYGNMLTGPQYFNGKYYYFEPDGREDITKSAELNVMYNIPTY